MDAVIARETNTCTLAAVELRTPGPTDVVVRIEASGICHSDASVMTGQLPSQLPCVLGHEGAGTVVETGRDVTRVRPGDRVVLSAIPSCGSCYFCARGEFNLCERTTEIRRPAFVDDGRPVPGAAGLGTFAEALVVSELAAIPVRSELPSEQLALIGCAILTGAGSVLNYADVKAGDSVLIVGAGGIGLAAVQAARLQSALPIAVIDPSPAAQALARHSGATHVYSPDDVGVDDALLDVTEGRGFDSVIECVGVPDTTARAWELTRRGGTIVIVGVGPRDAPIPIPLVQIPMTGRRLVGCVYGGSAVHRDVPRYVALAEAGLLDFATMIGRRVGLRDVPELLAAPHLPAGRTVILNG